MSERALWAYLRRGMRGRWDACRHEDALGEGVPDVSYGIEARSVDDGGARSIQGTNGWIELKFVRSLPKRKETPIDIGLTARQAAWLRRRGMQGGNCWVLVQIETGYFLFTWHQAKWLRQPRTIEELARCSINWNKRIVWDLFHDYIALCGR